MIRLRVKQVIGVAWVQVLPRQGWVGETGSNASLEATPKEQIRLNHADDNNDLNARGFFSGR
jgi:hypothetical protein